MWLGFRFDNIKSMMLLLLDYSVSMSGTAHQRHQQRRWPGLPQERMGQQFGGGRPLRRISNQHSIEESLQTCRHFVHVLQVRRFRVANSSHCLQRRFVEERRFTVHHFDDHYAKWPDVHLGTVWQPGNYFGRHPVRRADERFSLG